MPHNQEIGLQWVIVNNEIHHVSNYAHLKPTERPIALCPLCREPVTMKLGHVRAYHVAHQPDAVCIATQPETILHLNTKLYIAEQLKNATQLLILNQCTSDYDCDSVRNEIFASGWIDVKVEMMVGSRKPDISLLNGNSLVAAIEVCVTHAVDEEKAKYLQEHNISWGEIAASEEFYSGPNAWTADQAMPFITLHPKPKYWVCDQCKQKAEHEAEREKRMRIEESLRYSSKTYMALMGNYLAITKRPILP